MSKTVSRGVVFILLLTLFCMFVYSAWWSGESLENRRTVDMVAVCIGLGAILLLVIGAAWEFAKDIINIINKK